jgi:inosine-uridine nucleoside N-ribohydrolase
MTRIPAATTAPGHVRRWRIGENPWQEGADPVAPAMRVIVDNDFAGDPDDLFQLVHQLLSPSAEVRLVIASHLAPGDFLDPGPNSAAHAALVVRDVFARMGLESPELIIAGAEEALTDVRTPQPSAAADAIIDEALREDTELPLYYVAGGGLTDLASALLIEPRIAQRMTLVWIGGAEHDGHAAPPPGAGTIEYNLDIDLVAGQVVFDESTIPIWQVPRNVYRQCLVSETELRRRVAVTGPIGRFLHDETAFIMRHFQEEGPRRSAESYVLGDSPLVLLTALQSFFEPDPSSSEYVEVSTPLLGADGGYQVRDEDASGARPMRVYTQVDTRLMFEDLFAKLAEFDSWLVG